MSYQGMADAELDAAIADASVQFTAAWHEKQRRAQSAPPTTLERAITKHRRLFALLAACAAITLGSLLMRLFR